jgi:hypothetical protein
MSDSIRMRHRRLVEAAQKVVRASDHGTPGGLGVAISVLRTLLAQEVSERPCAGCGRAMPLAPGQGRSDKRTCSERCRTQVMRLRRYKAIKMHEAGYKLAHICRQVGSCPVNVKKWIEEAKKKGK